MITTKSITLLIYLFIIICVVYWVWFHKSNKTKGEKVIKDSLKNNHQKTKIVDSSSIMTQLNIPHEENPFDFSNNQPINTIEKFEIKNPYREAGFKLDKSDHVDDEINVEDLMKKFDDSNIKNLDSAFESIQKIINSNSSKNKDNAD